MHTDEHGLNKTKDEALWLGSRCDSISTVPGFNFDGGASPKTKRRLPFFIRVNPCSSVDQFRLEFHHAA